ncbi:MAG TPA: hypothetical protein VG433_11350 [Pirellulales bacterium]|jgi:hypothetical protein|nr:hypothetical protein [Pirellulales bacterium]
MLLRLSILSGWLAVLAATGPIQAADVRYYQENGVTYRETRYTVQHPVTETVLVDQQHTVYREKVDTTLQDSVRTVQVPVTEYRSEMFVVNRWNPFAKPYLAQRLVPVTRMVTRTETAKLPVGQRQLVPVTTTVKVPVVRTRMVNEEITSRIAVAGPPPTAPSPTSPPASNAPAVAAGSSPKTAASAPIGTQSR